MSIPRPEYPRPQLVRDDWMNLNGEWEFALDPGKSGRARGMVDAAPFERKIIVPFCPESELSGISNKDFMPCVWYRKSFGLPSDWQGKRVLLHFGAVDYDTEVWVNGSSVGKHRGGYVGFAFEITQFLKPGENTVVVCAEDDVRSGLQPSGKQSFLYGSAACHYTRTTGIWQTVWLEAVPTTYISHIRITPDLENGRAHVVARIDGPCGDLHLSAIAKLCGEDVGGDTVRVAGGLAQLDVSIEQSKLLPWSPGNPTLYDLELVLESGNSPVDRVSSYFGLRSLGIDGYALLLNGEPLFQRLVLDQGYYLDGIYTAPTDEALRRDIELSMAMGFNGARLHQKVFEERFLYWADKLGYIVWGEMASWGVEMTDPVHLERFQTEWLEVLDRDYSHPSIVGWCPLNETPVNRSAEIQRQIYRLTKQIDPTRPCIDTSGYTHAELTDVYDVHDYEQNPNKLASHFVDRLPSQYELDFPPDKPIEPRPQRPYLNSEYGGIRWDVGQTAENAWGYGDSPKTEEEFLTRYKGLTEVLLAHPKMCGFCYTQLTDVEQEVNGLYTYHRKPKFDPAVIYAVNSQKAAIETVGTALRGWLHSHSGFDQAQDLPHGVERQCTKEAP